MAYIDGCEFARDAEFHGIPKMDDNMENFYFDSNYRALVDVIAWDGIDISSYDKNFLYTIAQHFSKHYKVLTDRIEEFNSRYVTFRG